MTMTLLKEKEKPDLLFNNPLKQKVYVFLKSNPGKDYETFQVLTGDSAVSRQHFNEVEQAIRAREERDRARAVPRDVNALFLLRPEKVMENHPSRRPVSATRNPWRGAVAALHVSARGSPAVVASNPRVRDRPSP